MVFVVVCFCFVVAVFVLFVFCLFVCLFFVVVFLGGGWGGSLCVCTLLCMLLVWWLRFYIFTFNI